MAEILFLSQRVPYPPEKGDKIRSFNLLKELARNHVVRLGSFVDDPRDWERADELKPYCAEIFLLPLGRRMATLRSLRGFLTGDPLSKPFYYDRRLTEWVSRTMVESRPDVAFIFSSAMAQYVLLLGERPGAVVMDFVDVDSLKWASYAKIRRGISRWIYRREADRLLAHDAAVARAADLNLFVSEQEAELFRKLVPDVSDKLHALSNGVDTVFFDPSSSTDLSVQAPSFRIVFTGAMDYWPNVEAVTWFADHVFENLRRQHPNAEFQIVGLNPHPQVEALGHRPGIEVTGRVVDVRPYLNRATVVIAPMEIGRGIQNKVLEAMAMARPVVVSAEGLEGISATPGRDLICAERAPQSFLGAVLAAAEPETAARLGDAARRYVQEHHSWEASGAKLEALLDGLQRQNRTL